MTRNAQLLIRRTASIIDRFNAATAHFSNLSLWLLTAAVLYDVAIRFYGMSTLWASELSVYLMLAVAFLGAGATHSVDGHFRVTLIRNLCAPPVRYYFDLTSLIVSLVFVVAFGYGSLGLLLFSWSLDLRTSTLLHVPMWLLHSILFLGSLFLMISIVRDLLFFVMGENPLEASEGGQEAI